MHSTTLDISEFCQFEWYPQYLVDHNHKRKLLGRWLGVAQQVGGAMVSWILPILAQPVTQSTVTEVSVTDVIIYTATLSLQQKGEFDNVIKRLEQLATKFLLVETLLLMLMNCSLQLMQWMIDCLRTCLLILTFMNRVVLMHRSSPLMTKIYFTVIQWTLLMTYTTCSMNASTHRCLTPS